MPKEILAIVEIDDYESVLLKIKYLLDKMLSKKQNVKDCYLSIMGFYAIEPHGILSTCNLVFD